MQSFVKILFIYFSIQVCIFSYLFLLCIFLFFKTYFLFLLEYSCQQQTSNNVVRKFNIFENNLLLEVKQCLDVITSDIVCELFAQASKDMQFISTNLNDSLVYETFLKKKALFRNKGEEKEITEAEVQSIFDPKQKNPRKKKPSSATTILSDPERLHT